MSKYMDFRKMNHIKQGDMAEYLGVTQGFISQIENGKRPLPDDMLKKIIANAYGWDTSMLIESSPITATASDHSSASVNIGVDKGTLDELASLRSQVEQLRQQLLEEKARSDKYWEMIERLTK